MKIERAVAPRVVLESPFAGKVERNIRYARLCIYDCLLKGEAPIASHLLYTQDNILKDSRPEERLCGIEAGLAWARHANFAVFYLDFGMTHGMIQAADFYRREGITTFERYLSGLSLKLTELT